MFAQLACSLQPPVPRLLENVLLRWHVYANSISRKLRHVTSTIYTADDTCNARVRARRARGWFFCVDGGWRGRARARVCSPRPASGFKAASRGLVFTWKRRERRFVLVVRAGARRGGQEGDGVQNGSKEFWDEDERGWDRGAKALGGRKRLRVFNARCSNSGAEGVFFDHACCTHAAHSLHKI